MCTFIHKKIVRHKSTILQGKILAMARFTGNSHFFFWFALKKVKIFTERIFYDKGHLPDRFLCFFIFLKSFLRSLLSCLSPRAWPVGRGFWGASELTDDFLDEDLVDFTTGTDVAFNWLNLTIWSELKYVISPLSFNFIYEYY